MRMKKKTKNKQTDEHTVRHLQKTLENCTLDNRKWNKIITQNFYDSLNSYILEYFHTKADTIWLH